MDAYSLRLLEILEKIHSQLKLMPYSQVGSQPSVSQKLDLCYTLPVEMEALWLGIMEVSQMVTNLSMVMI